MDALGSILQSISLRGSVYFDACFGSEWGMELVKFPHSIFHIIVKGEAWLQMASPLEKNIKLVSGDIVLFPTGSPHKLSKELDSECVPASSIVEAYANGERQFFGSEKEFTIICGYIDYNNFFEHPFLTNLPGCIHVNSSMRSQFHWLNSVIDHIVLESKEPKPAGAVLIDKFTEILFIQIIRAYMEETKYELSYLAALANPQLSKALSLIHDRLDTDWTIDSLAEEVGMSRSSLYNRFYEHIGVPPMKYLYEWRMQHAKMEIENTKKSLSIIAEEVGYNSDAAFQKAFKRFFDRTPASFRKSKTGLLNIFKR